MPLILSKRSTHCLSLCRSLLLGTRLLHVATEALAYTAVSVRTVFLAALVLRALGAISRAAHHILAEGATLLDGRLQVLVRLLLDSLRIL